MIGLVEQKDFELLMKRVEELEKQNKAKDGEIAALKHRVSALDYLHKWQKQEHPWPNIPPGTPPMTPWYNPAPSPGWPTPAPVWCGSPAPKMGYAQADANILLCNVNEADALK